MTVSELLAALADVPGDHVVTCSPGGGVLAAITPTVNGFVILDARPLPFPAVERSGGDPGS